MKHIIEKYKNSFSYIDYCLIEEKLELLQSLYDDIKKCYSNISSIKDRLQLLEAYKNIDLEKIIKLYLLIEYEFSIDELNKMTAYILDLLSYDVNKKILVENIGYLDKEESNNKKKNFLSKFVDVILFMAKHFVKDFENNLNILINLSKNNDFKETIDIFDKMFNCKEQLNILIKNSKVMKYSKESIIKNKKANCILEELISSFKKIYEEKEYMIKDKLYNYSSYIKKAQKNNNYLKEVDNNILKITSILEKEYIAYFEILKLKDIIKDDTLFNEILIYILKNTKFSVNNKYKNKLEIMFRNLFNKYNYNYDILDETIKLSIKDRYDEIDELLSVTSKNGILLSNTNLEKVLIDGNISLICNIKGLFSKGYLNNSYINNNIQLLCDSEYQSAFLKNIDYFLSMKINILQLINNNVQLGIIDSDLLKRNLEIYNMYNINFKDKQFHNFSFLTNPKCFSVIDGFIEEGLLFVIKEHPEYIKEENKDMIKRIHINNLINSEVLKEDRIDSKLVYAEKYFIEDSSLDKYLCSHTIEYQDKNIKDILDKSVINKISNELEENTIVRTLDNKYKNKTGELYIINDILISRIKFLRNMEALKDYDSFSLDSIVFNCLINNSYLIDDEIIEIKDIVDDILVKGKILKKE